MAEPKTTDIIEEIKGRLGGKNGATFRRKTIRDENGNVIHTCKAEVYKVMNPRDFKKKPMKGKEKEHTELWAEACRRSVAESKEEHARHTYWRERWNAQLKKADPLAPTDKQTGKKKIYYQFNCFVRAAILWELQSK